MSQKEGENANKDLDQKLLVYLLFRQSGYVPQFEIRLRTKSYIDTFKSHDVSDIDVLGYKFESDLGYRELGAECKSGEANALDDLFKFKGTMTLRNIQHGYLVKSRLHQNAREIAGGLGIRVLTEAELREFLLPSNPDLERSQREIKSLYIKHQKIMEHMKISHKRFHDYVLYEYWNKPDWQNIHNLRHLFTTIQKEVSADQQQEKFFAGFILITMGLFARSILKIISDSICISFSDLRNSLTVSLFGGPESFREKQRLFDNMSQVNGTNEKFLPDWIVDLTQFGERLARYPKSAATIPEVVDQLISKVDLSSDKPFIQNIQITEDIVRKYVQDLVEIVQALSGAQFRHLENILKL